MKLTNRTKVRVHHGDWEPFTADLVTMVGGQFNGKSAIVGFGSIDIIDERWVGFSFERQANGGAE